MLTHNFRIIKRRKIVFNEIPLLFGISGVARCGKDTLAKHLKDKGVYTSFRYYPLHKVKYYDDGLSLKNSESIMDRTLCIPLHQSLTDDDVNHICDVIYNFNL